MTDSHCKQWKSLPAHTENKMNPTKNNKRRSKLAQESKIEFSNKLRFRPSPDQY
ncbi:MAG TPA: hypothetical protein VH481_09375 [Nitrososphaeraceae archaeon]